MTRLERLAIRAPGAGGPVLMGALLLGGPHGTVAAQTDREVASRYLGIWQGRVNQPGSPPYGVVLSIREAGDGSIEGSVGYPELACGGSLTPISLATAALVLEERIQYGVTVCVPVGRIQLRSLDAETMRYEWYYLDGELAAWASVRRTAEGGPQAASRSPCEQPLFRALPDCKALAALRDPELIGVSPAAASDAELLAYIAANRDGVALVVDFGQIGCWLRGGRLATGSSCTCSQNTVLARIERLRRAWEWVELIGQIDDLASGTLRWSGAVASLAGQYAKVGWMYLRMATCIRARDLDAVLLSYVRCRDSGVSPDLAFSQCAKALGGYAIEPYRSEDDTRAFFEYVYATWAFVGPERARATLAESIANAAKGAGPGR